MSTLVVADLVHRQKVEFFVRSNLALPLSDQREIRHFQSQAIWIVSTQVDHIVWIRNWNELLHALSRPVQVEKLILWTHGAAHEIIVNHVHRDIRDIARLISGRRLVAQHVEFEGCNIGRDPNALQIFGEAFGSTTIAAYTWYHTTQTVSIDVPPGGLSEQRMREVRRPYERYLLPNQLLPSEMGRRPGHHQLAAEWFRQTRDTSPPPEYHSPGFLSTGYATRRGAGFIEYLYYLRQSPHISLPGTIDSGSIPFQYVRVCRIQ